MRVVVVGATGNVGTSVVPRLAEDPAVEAVVGVARRLPELEVPKTEWRAADVTRDDLRPLFRGADAVVHLAWRIQPSRSLEEVWLTNVVGTTRVLEAVAAERVPAVVYASSVGAYSPGPKDRRVDESWPTRGTPTSFYARHKAEVERRLDRFEQEVPSVRVTRLRPGLVFKREAASGVRRLFAGPFLPTSLLGSRLPIVPDLRGLRFQAVHGNDLADAYRLAVLREDARGAYNVAAEPILDPDVLARRLGAWKVPLPVRVARAAVAVSWRVRLQPTPVGWLDLGLSVPLLDCTRIREQLGWDATIGADDALAELLEGMRAGAGAPTPPLSPSTGGPLRLGELASGVGGREHA